MIRSLTFLFLCLRFQMTACIIVNGCWPDNVIPYKISHGFNTSQTYKIHEVIAEFHRFTCIRWVDDDKISYNATDKVIFQKVEQKYVCHPVKSLLSNGGEMTVVLLGDYCFEKRVLMHAMMHVLGFYHEHQRSDRDCYVFVNLTEVAKVPAAVEDFQLVHERWLERFPYDSNSNTHFERSTVLKAQDTEKLCEGLRPLYPMTPLGNQKGELTSYDVWKILYKFCGFFHFCDVFPHICSFMDEVEKHCSKRNQFEKM